MAPTTCGASILQNIHICVGKIKNRVILDSHMIRIKKILKLKISFTLLFFGLFLFSNCGATVSDQNLPLAQGSADGTGDSAIIESSDTSIEVTPASGTVWNSFLIDLGAHFLSENICSGKTIFGRVGTALCSEISPTNITGTVAAWSLRRVDPAYTGPLLRVRRSSDDQESDIGFNSSGDLDEAALLDFVGSDSAYVSVWYNQASSGPDAFQLTNGAQPRIVDAGVVEKKESKPAIAFLSANSTWLDTGVESFGSTGIYADGTQSFTISTVFNIAYNSNGVLMARADDNGGSRTFYVHFFGSSFRTQTPSIVFRGTSTTGGWSMDDGNNRTLGFRWNAAQLRTRFNSGILQITSVGGAAEQTGQRFIIGARTNGTNFFLNGSISEILIYDSALSDEDFELLQQNQNQYFNAY
jgi:hypothetical protein